MKPSAKRVEICVAGKDMILESGRIARQASGAILLRCGDSVLLATVVAKAGRADLDFFPLTVEYREKMAAAGMIPGNIGRREARISDHEVLTSRLIDRSLRSLFPRGYKREVQVQVSVLSADPQADLTTLAITAACAAVHISPLPAQGPVAGLRIAQIDGHLTAFPSEQQRLRADLDFVLSAGPRGLVMVEGEAREIGDQACLGALEQALAWIEKIRAGIAELSEMVGNEPDPVPDPEAIPEIPADLETSLGEALKTVKKQARNELVAAMRDSYLQGIDAAGQQAARSAFEAKRATMVRDSILSGGKRLDGREPAQVRPIWCETGWLPRTHGSAIFTRGETQALVTCTLGSDQDAQRLDSLSGHHREHFLLHYNFPPYSVGEIRPLRGPGRREIGHGFLARRGLAPLMPDFGEFPYTIRIEAEITESNGSSSMASACGACLAMFDAGVPLRRMVAGIAMGLITDGQRTIILSDILGDEDHLGDMDFKVVGTSKGITALQLDNKVGGLSAEQIEAALKQARKGLDFILGEMAETLASPRSKLSSYAPQVFRMSIMPDTISLLVGPRGSNIKAISASSGCRINVDDDGLVLIYAPDEAAAKRAEQLVGKSVGVVKAGRCYTGKVTGVKDFGAFVRINPLTEGLVPREQLLTDVAAGDGVVVLVEGCDDRGRLRLSITKAQDIDPAAIEF